MLLAGCGGSATVSTSPAPASTAGGSAAAGSASASPSSAASAKPSASGPASAAASSTSSSPASASSSGAANGSVAGSAAAGGAGTAIKIGYLNSLTGNLSGNGVDGKDGLDLFLGSVNNTLAGHPVQVVYADDQSLPDVGVTKAQGLVGSDKVDLVMGITSSAVCQGVAQYMKTTTTPLMVTANCGVDELTFDPKYASPYLVRFSQATGELFWGMQDYAIKQNWKKLDLITSDYVGGLQVADMFGAAFIEAGGSIIQELHPKMNTTDFGPYISQIDQSADAVAVFLPGADSLRFYQQLLNYGSKKQILDLGSQITNGPVMSQLKEKAIGIIASNIYSEGYDGAANQTMLKAFRAKYPDRPISSDIAQSWSAGQILQAALEKVNGNVADKPALMNALWATNMETAKGPIKVNQNHDVVQNTYVFQIVQGGPLGFQQKLLSSKNSGPEGDFPAAVYQKFPFSQLDNKVAGLDKAKLDGILNSAK